MKCKLKYRTRQQLKQAIALALVFIWWFVARHMYKPPDVDISILPVYWMSTDKEFEADMRLALEEATQGPIIPIRVLTDDERVLCQRAFEAGHDTVLVIKDGAMFSPLLFKHWHRLLASAPTNWDMLQLWTDNRLIQDHVQQLRDPWISWMPEHTNSVAFAATRDGLKKCYERNGTLFARGHTYTATRFYVKTQYMFEFPFQAQTWPKPKDSVLVITTMRLNTKIDISDELDRWLADAHSMQADWHLTVVVPTKALQQLVLTMFPTMDHIRCSVIVHKGGYNKFVYIRDSIPNMRAYTHVIIKDSDQNLAGFPWRSFVQRAADAVIAGPLRQTLMGHPDKRQWAKVTDAYVFKDNWSRRFGDVQTLAVGYLEQYFVAMDGAFAEWYFSKILTDNMLYEEGTAVASSWGPDILWCAAAKEWAPHRTPCIFVPVVSKHDDTRQIQHWKSSALAKYTNQRQKQKYRDAFPSWDMVYDVADVAH